MNLERIKPRSAAEVFQQKSHAFGHAEEVYVLQQFCGPGWRSRHGGSPKACPEYVSQPQQHSVYSDMRILQNSDNQNHCKYKTCTTRYPDVVLQTLNQQDAQSSDWSCEPTLGMVARSLQLHNRFECRGKFAISLAIYRSARALVVKHAGPTNCA